MSNTAVTTTPFIIRAKPGVQRDGTTVDADGFTDGQWVRFQRGRPQKMGGWRLLNGELTGPVRAQQVSAKNGLNYNHLFSPSTIERLTFNAGGASSPVSRTPSGFAINVNNLAQSAIMYDATASSDQILALVAPNVVVDQETETPLYLGDLTGTSILTTTGDSSAIASGGVTVIGPHAILFGNAGIVKWSVPNEPTDFTSTGAGAARITGLKIVAASPTRGGGQPAGLFWSLNALVRGIRVGGTTVFDFDTITEKSSILSPNSIVEKDGVFYWIAMDRFLLYNGRVQELPNEMNRNWFFRNLNFDQRGKVWGSIIPAYNQLIWFYPRGSATECTHYIAIDLSNGAWTDGEMMRSSGFYAQTFPYPLMTGLVPNANDKYPLYQHEYGWDAIEAAGVPLAVPSFIETNCFSPLLGNRGINEPMVDRFNRLDLIEYDMIQTGVMTLSVYNRKYPRSDDAVHTFQIAENQEQQKMSKEATQARLQRLRFTSNVVGGYYEFGEHLLHMGMGDQHR